MTWFFAYRIIQEIYQHKGMDPFYGLRHQVFLLMTFLGMFLAWSLFCSYWQGLLFFCSSPPIVELSYLWFLSSQVHRFRLEDVPVDELEDLDYRWVVVLFLTKQVWRRIWWILFILLVSLEFSLDWSIKVILVFISFMIITVKLYLVTQTCKVDLTEFVYEAVHLHQREDSLFSFLDTYECIVEPEVKVVNVYMDFLLVRYRNDPTPYILGVISKSEEGQLHHWMVQHVTDMNLVFLIQEYTGENFVIEGLFQHYNVKQNGKQESSLPLLCSENDWTSDQLTCYLVVKQGKQRHLLLVPFEFVLHVGSGATKPRNLDGWVHFLQRERNDHLELQRLRQV
jgi:hypothetical protein